MRYCNLGMFGEVNKGDSTNLCERLDKAGCGDFNKESLPTLTPRINDI